MTSNSQFPGDRKRGVESELIKKKDLDYNIIGTDYTYKHEIIWTNVIGFGILHILALWGFYLTITGAVQLKTFIFSVFIAYVSIEGVTIGAHRLYTHRSFKATPLLRAILLLLHTCAGQNSMYIWCRDHRLHHRCSDTDADPHNAKRGFFFSHIGWLLTKRHPLATEHGRKIDLSDLEADWMVMFQKKYYTPLFILIGVIFPVWVPIYFFNESFKVAILVNFCMRNTMQLHGTWFINSIAHLYGTRPYDKNIQPVQSWLVSILSFGEGRHNYHHAFPRDYKVGEISDLLNPSAQVIEFFAKLGMAYDLKSASLKTVADRVKKSGDGTHSEFRTEESKAAVKETRPLYPANPNYTMSYKNPEGTLHINGLSNYQDNDVLDCGDATDIKIIECY